MPRKKKNAKTKRKASSVSSIESSPRKISHVKNLTVSMNEQHENLPSLNNTALFEDQRYSLSGNTDNFYDSSDESLLEEFSLYLSMKKKEESLKLAIIHEKLQKEKPIKNKAVLSKNISEQRNILEESTKQIKMKNTMTSSIQIGKTLQNLFNQHEHDTEKETDKLDHFTDEERKSLLDLLKRKKEINKEISQYQKEIASLEENCVKLNETIENSVCKPTKKPREMRNAPDSGEEEQLKQLESDNRKRNSRIQLLSKITVSLIDHIEDKENLKDDVKVLAESCKRILEWDYDDLDEMEELCKSVYSTEI